jgi:hypothetical protein
LFSLLCFCFVLVVLVSCPVSNIVFVSASGLSILEYPVRFFLMFILTNNEKTIC